MVTKEDAIRELARRELERRRAADPNGGMSIRPYGESSPFAGIGSADQPAPDVTKTEGTDISRRFALPTLGPNTEPPEIGPQLAQAPLDVAGVRYGIRTDEGIKPYGPVPGFINAIFSNALFGDEVQGTSGVANLLGEGVGYAGVIKALKLLKMGPLATDLTAGAIKGALRPEATPESVALETGLAGLIPAIGNLAKEPIVAPVAKEVTPIIESAKPVPIVEPPPVVPKLKPRLPEEPSGVKSLEGKGATITGMPDVSPNKATWYHGTAKEFDNFSMDNANADLGVYFTTDKKLAQFYTSEQVHGTGGTPRVIESSIEPKNVLDMRFGRQDKGGISTVIDGMLSRAQRLAEHDEIPISAAGERAANKLSQARGEMSSATSVEQWKAGEAKLYDAAMDIAKAENAALGKSYKTFSTAPLREELQSLGYDAVRKVDDGADALVVLDTKIIKKSPAPPPAVKPKEAVPEVTQAENVAVRGGKPPSTPPEEQIAAPIGEGGGTRLTKADIAEARFEKELPQLDPEQPVVIRTVLDDVKKTDYTSKAKEVISRINNRAEGEIPSLNHTEEAVLGLHYQDLNKAYESAASKYAGAIRSGDDIVADISRNEMSRFKGEIDELQQAARTGSAEAGRLLRFVRETGESTDRPLAEILDDLALRKKAPLTPEEVARVTEHKTTIDNLKAQVDDLTKKEAEWQAERERLIAEKVVAHETKQTKIAAKSGKAKESIHVDREAAKKKLRDLGYHVNEGMVASAEASYYVGKLAVSYIREGAVTLKEVAEKVMADIPSITERDVWEALNARNPKVVAKQRSILDKRVSHLKTMARLKVQIEDALDGILPEKAAKAPTPTDIKALQKQLREIVKEAEGSYGSGERLARLQETVNKLQDQLENKYRSIKNPKKVGPPEAAELKRQASELKSRLRIDDELADINEQLRTGIFKSRLPRRRVLSPQLQDAQIKLREQRDLLDQAVNSASGGGAWYEIERVANTARTAQSFGDISASLRQGLVLAIANPKAAAVAQGRAIKAMFNKDYAKRLYNEMVEQPSYQEAKRFGMEYSSLGTPGGVREEYFLNGYFDSNPALKPFKPIVKASETHMALYLNMLRDSYYTTFRRAIPNATEQEIRAVIDFVNKASGRGNISGLGKAAKYMQFLFFAPRFAASRIQTPLTLWKYRSIPRVRNYIAKDMGKTLAAGAATLTLAKAAGADVGLDPRSSDFGKIKIGDTRVDIWAGFQQPARLAFQFIEEAGTATVGFPAPIKGHKYDAVESASRFLAYKGSPALTTALEQLFREEITGQPFPPGWQPHVTQFGEKWIPLFLQDVADAYQEGGIGKAAWVVPLTASGIGVSTYQKKKKPFKFTN